MIELRNRDEIINYLLDNNLYFEIDMDEEILATLINDPNVIINLESSPSIQEENIPPIIPIKNERLLDDKTEDDILFEKVRDETLRRKMKLKKQQLEYEKYKREEEEETKRIAEKIEQDKIEREKYLESLMNRDIRDILLKLISLLEENKISEMRSYMNELDHHKITRINSLSKNNLTFRSQLKKPENALLILKHNLDL